MKGGVNTLKFIRNKKLDKQMSVKFKILFRGKAVIFSKYARNIILQ